MGIFRLLKQLIIKDDVDQTIFNFSICFFYIMSNMAL